MAEFGGSKADLQEPRAEIPKSQDLNLTSTVKERLHFRAICPPHPFRRKQRGAPESLFDHNHHGDAISVFELPALTGNRSPRLCLEIRHPSTSWTRVGAARKMHPKFRRKRTAGRCHRNHQWV